MKTSLLYFRVNKRIEWANHSIEIFAEKEMSTRELINLVV